MIELHDDHVFYAFSRDLEPVLDVDSGTTVRIRTKDCFGNQVQTPEDELDSIDWDAINPATGPVFVNGAKPGGALKVAIENIEFDGRLPAARARTKACAAICSKPGARACAR